jgi:hypothetical protein
MVMANFEHRNNERYNSPDQDEEACPEGKERKPSLRMDESVCVQMV